MLSNLNKASSICQENLKKKPLLQTRVHLSNVANAIKNTFQWHGKIDKGKLKKQRVSRVPVSFVLTHSGKYQSETFSV